MAKSYDRTTCWQISVLEVTKDMTSSSPNIMITEFCSFRRIHFIPWYQRKMLTLQSNCMIPHVLLPRLQLAPMYGNSLKGIQYEIHSFIYFTRNVSWAAFLLLRLVCLMESHSLKLGQEGSILFWRQLTNKHLKLSLRWRQGLRLKPLIAYSGDEICLMSLQPTPPPLHFPSSSSNSLGWLHKEIRRMFPDLALRLSRLSFYLPLVTQAWTWFIGRREAFLKKYLRLYK